MSLYDKLSNSNLRIKRRLFDYHVGQLGRTTKVVRIQYQEDMYKDLTDVEALSSNEISVIFNFPDYMPLDRYRLDGTDYVEDTRTFFFDLLPIEVFTKLEDTIEKRDLLFFWFKDENENSIPMLLQISEVFGRFETGLVWKKAFASPIYGSLTQPLYKLLKDYYTPEKLDTVTEEPLLRENSEEAEDPHMVREQRIKDIME